MIDQSSEFVKALSDAGVAIAALTVLIVFIVAMVLIVRSVIKALKELIEALERIGAADDVQNKELASMRADVDKQTEAIRDLERRFEKLPADIRTELTKGFSQLLDSIAKIVDGSAKNEHSKWWPF